MYDKFLHSFNCRLNIDGTSHQHYIPYQIEIGISIVILIIFQKIPQHGYVEIRASSCFYIHFYWMDIYIL